MTSNMHMIELILVLVIQKWHTQYTSMMMAFEKKMSISDFVLGVHPVQELELTIQQL